jgi:hypothetical protein
MRALADKHTLAFSGPQELARREERFVAPAMASGDPEMITAALDRAESAVQRFRLRDALAQAVRAAQEQHHPYVCCH